jgi:hypothetical protein
VCRRRSRTKARLYVGFRGEASECDNDQYTGIVLSSRDYARSNQPSEYCACTALVSARDASAICSQRALLEPVASRTRALCTWRRAFGARTDWANPNPPTRRRRHEVDGGRPRNPVDPSRLSANPDTRRPFRFPTTASSHRLVVYIYSHHHHHPRLIVHANDVAHPSVALWTPVFFYHPSSSVRVVSPAGRALRRGPRRTYVAQRWCLRLASSAWWRELLCSFGRRGWDALDVVVGGATGRGESRTA